MICKKCGAEIAATPCPRCLLAGPLPETTLAKHFVLGDAIGAGGMGTVFKAKDTRVDRDVAVKLLDAPADTAVREAKALARLSHPNIVTLLEANVDDGQAYLVMELVDGTSLRRRGTLFAKELVDVALQIAAALAYAHEHGVLHRDIKPDNVLIDREGRVKVTDFGIAKLTNTAPSAQTQRGLLAGTQGYVAPELLRGAPATPQSDVYALGVLLYELATGELPAGNAAPLAWPLDGVVRRAMAQDPSARFQSMREVVSALEAASRALQASALPPDEVSWLRAVALLFTAASGLGLWTLLQSISPIVVDGENIYPLARTQLRRLQDGRLVSFARLEIGGALGTLAAFALAVAAFGVLRWHWRKHGLYESRPDLPLKESRRVLLFGGIAMVIFFIRRALIAAELTAVASYVPVVGAAIELAILYALWSCVLEATRLGRSVTKEPLMWLGFWLGLVPPAIELLTYIRSLPLAQP